MEPAAPSVGPSHSHSIGELASFLHASKQPSKDDASLRNREPAESKDEKAKHFWQRNQDPSQPIMKTKSSTHKDVKSKPVAENLAPLPSSKDGGTKRHRSTSPAVEGSPPPSPKKKHKKEPQKKVEVQKKLDVKKADAQPQKMPEPHKKAEMQMKPEAQKRPSSPKWFHFPGKHQQRSRSESPDREKKGGYAEAKGKGHAEVREKGEYPLEVAASASSVGAEGAEHALSAGEAQINVLDRIKQYNTKDAAIQKQVVSGTEKGGDTAKSARGESGQEKGKGEVKSVGVDRGKQKEKGGKGDVKRKDQAGDKKSDKKLTTKEAKAKKESGAAKHWNPFKKSQKNSKDDGKKGKKATKTAMKPLRAAGESAQMFAGVKNRIEMLKELGLETDGTDGDDAVLVSVVQRSDDAPDTAERPDGEGGEEEEGEEGARGDEDSTVSEEEGETDSEEEEETREGKEEVVSFGGSSPEVKVPPPSPDKELSPELNVIEKVKKLREMHEAISMKRPRCFTEAKR